MRQLVELSEHLDDFRARNAAVVAIAQEETDPRRLAHTRRFVGDGLLLLADPERASWKTFSRYGVYVADSKGVVRSHVSGTKVARPRLDVVLGELDRIAGAHPRQPAVQDGPEPDGLQAGEPAPLDSTAVLRVRWLWSHDAIRSRARIRLALVARVAPGWHVYGFGEKAMTPFSLELELPEGIVQRGPIEYPRPRRLRDPTLERVMAIYEGDVPISAITLQAGPDLRPGRLIVRARLRFQACNDSVCLPPAEKVVELPIEAVGPDQRRTQIAGWQRW